MTHRTANHSPRGFGKSPNRRNPLISMKIQRRQRLCTLNWCMIGTEPLAEVSTPVVTLSAAGQDRRDPQQIAGFPVTGRGKFILLR